MKTMRIGRADGFSLVGYVTLPSMRRFCLHWKIPIHYDQDIAESKRDDENLPYTHGGPKVYSISLCSPSHGFMTHVLISEGFLMSCLDYTTTMISVVCFPKKDRQHV